LKLEEFALERIQSVWEHSVEINLAESGIEPVKLSEIVDIEALRDVKLGYPQTNGSIELRRHIASMYGGATEDNIVVTNGGSEANMVTVWNLKQESGDRDEIVIELPNYMQIWGVAGAFGLKRKSFWLRAEDNRWVPDIEGLKEKVSRKTLAIAVCTPNNPTGSVMKSEHLRAIAEIAEDCGAIVLSDEIYRGAELSGDMSPSMWDHSDNVIVTGGLSKVFAAPGLRIGWVVSKMEGKASEMWAYTDYTSISPSLLGDRLGQIVMQPSVRERIIERSRNILRRNWTIVSEWLKNNANLFECIPPEASAICLIKYEHELDSEALAERLIKEKSVLIAPGDHFLVPKHFRLGYGHDASKLEAGLQRVAELMRA